MSRYYIEPTSKQLYYRYNGITTTAEQQVNWMPVVVTVGVVALVGIVVCMSMEKQKWDISQLGQQQLQLSRVSKINEHTLNNFKKDVSINTKSIQELRRDLALLKLQVELENTI